ncbi:MAG: hypothetical protein ACOCUU_03280 [Nanoarchaeota archaeon]
MAKQGGNVLNWLAWLTGVVVSLVVGNGMIQEILVLPDWLGQQYIPWLAVFIGWIIVITTLVSAVMAILKK